MQLLLRSAIASACFVFGSIAQAAPTYSALDLGAIPHSFERSQASSVNNLAQVAGLSTATNSTRAILWTPSPDLTSASMTDLGVLVDMQSANALAINARGQVVGRSNNGDRSRAFLWNPVAPNSTTGSIVELTNLPGERNRGAATGINARGQVVGLSGIHAFLWTPTVPNGTTGAAVDLQDLPGGFDSSLAADINSQGQVVGLGSAAAGTRAFLWTPTLPNGNTGAMIDLGSLINGGTSRAAAIDDSGRVVGTSAIDANGNEHAFLWTPGPNGGTMTDLLDLPGGNDMSSALGMNEVGQVVGYGTTLEGERAFLWTAADGMLNLNSLLDAESAADWSLTFAQGINDSGQIVGFGTYDPDGPGEQFSPAIHAYLLTPSSIAGDYNQNGVVDAADYVVWRKTDGSAAGYNAWRTNFGRTAGGGGAVSVTAVPEPAAALLFALGACAGVCVARRRRALR